MIGVQNTDFLELIMKKSQIDPLLGLPFSSNGRLCYKYARELWCHILSPRCYLAKEVIIHPCKESFTEFHEACLENMTSVLKRLQFEGSHWFKHTDLEKN